MKAIVIGIVIAIAILDVLLVIACGILETEEDKLRDDEAQIKWLKERK